MSSSSPLEIVSNDQAVISTNDDASICKKCAVLLGYWNDPYISSFVKKYDRKAPEINRGYFARTMAIQILTEKFIDVTHGKCQIINIGAGYDTLFWRLTGKNLTMTSYVELDFPEVTSRKCNYIQKSKLLLQGISHEDYDIQLNKNNLHAHKYKLLGVDIRNLSEIEAKFTECSMDFSLPTLFVTECVLVYLSLAKSSQLLRFLASKFKSALFLNYEMVNLQDRFGEVMLKNLRVRGCDLQGENACVNLKTQQERFTKEGWCGAESIDMQGVWNRLPPEDIARVTKIELLDEHELLSQLFSHYCITLAWTDSRWSEVQL